MTWLVFRATALLPPRLQIRAPLGTTQAIVNLGAPVNPGRDHIRGPDQAIVTIVEYGDFECPYCGQAEPVLRELLAGHGDVRYVWRHLPLNDVRPHAQLAAEAAEAAAGQGAFWAMHDLLSASEELPWRDLRAVWRPVIVLAVGLVLASAAAIAAVARAVAAIPASMAFVLGAVLASTDPVAVSALGRRLSLPPRVQALVQAESLFNDATSLVLFQIAVSIAVAAATSSSPDRRRPHRGWAVSQSQSR